jgi:hypothetical protein
VRDAKSSPDGPLREVNKSISVIVFNISLYLGKGGEFGGGEADEAVDDKVEKVLDVVHGFRLNETSFSKADYATYIKNYMKKVKAHLEAKNPERVQPFMAGAKEMVTWIMSKFDDFQL